MTLYGKLFLEGKLIREAEAGDDEAGRSFRDSLENCLLALCGSLDIPAPLWMKKNTREFAVFRRTFFNREQFIEKVWFDKFEIKLG